jgi:hypothetical protein
VGLFDLGEEEDGVAFDDVLATNSSAGKVGGYDDYDPGGCSLMAGR